MGDGLDATLALRATVTLLVETPGHLGFRQIRAAQATTVNTAQRYDRRFVRSERWKIGSFV